MKTDDFNWRRIKEMACENGMNFIMIFCMSAFTIIIFSLLKRWALANNFKPRPQNKSNSMNCVRDTHFEGTYLSNVLGSISEVYFDAKGQPQRSQLESGRKPHAYIDNI